MAELWICKLCGHERGTFVCSDLKCHCYCGAIDSETQGAEQHDN